MADRFNVICRQADVAQMSRGKGGAALREVVARNADEYARDLAPVVADIRAVGHVTLRAMAAELNRRGMMTRRGGEWHVSNMLKLLLRVDALPR